MLPKTGPAPVFVSVVVAIFVTSVSLAASPEHQTPPSESRQAPTFSRDVAPIVYEQCSTCHRPGESGPFPLLTYEDVRARGKQIADVVQRRVMPPWPPDGSGPPLVGERRLTDRQIGTLRSWVMAGMPQGDPALLPPRPQWPEGWQLGTPDLVVAMDQSFAMPAASGEVFRRFVAAIPLDRPRYVRAVEFRPGSAHVVHHAILRLDPTRSTRRLVSRPAEERNQGFGGMLFAEDASRGPEGFFLGWSPGRVATMGPPDLAWRLDSGTDLVFELHLMPTGSTEEVRAMAGFFFTDTPPARTPVAVQLGSYSIDIAPGDRNYWIEDSYRVPVDLDVLSVYPHAHYLAREVETTATFPDGTRKLLLRIPDWDFDWQDEYRFVEPVRLPKGSTLAMRIRYDNSAENPRNPRQRSERVVYGGRSVDEMGNVWMQVVPRDARDLNTLREDYRQKSLRRSTESYERLVAAMPDLAPIRLTLGSSYVHLGRLREGIEQLTEAVRLDDADPVAHYNLGSALSSAGEIERAQRHLARAIELKPDYAEAHNNLGAIARAQGRADDAVAHFTRAIKADPNFAYAQNNLGSTLRSLGRIDEAIEHYRHALAASPDYADARYNLGLALHLRGRTREAIGELERIERIEHLDHADALSMLAWILSTSRDAALRQPARAVTLAERAAALAAADASTIDTLAASYAANGQFEKAVEAGERALRLANGGGLKGLAAEIEARIALFRKKQPFIEK
jgi:tetratricopeptide (TPR) repeat protein